MNTRTLFGMTAAALFGLTGTSMGCYINNFDTGSPGSAQLFGDAVLDNGSLQMTPDVSDAAGAIVFDSFHGQTISRFDASFDYILNPGGTLGGANLILALGDLPDSTIPSADTVSGLAINIRAANIGGGFGNFVYVSVWLDGVAIVPEPSSGHFLPTTVWTSDVAVAISLDEAGILNVSIDGTPLVTGLATGYTPTEGHRLGIAATGGNGADQRIDNADIHVNPASITNMNTFTPYASLQSAINAATAGDSIELGEGIVCEWGMTIDKPITLSGMGMDETCIDANGLDDIFTLDNAGAITIEGMTIANGHSQSHGGAASIFGATSTDFRGVRFLNNECEMSGGALLVLTSDVQEQTVIDGCEFVENYAGSSGGAIAYLATIGQSTILNSVFRGNAAANGPAALRVNADMAFVDVINNTFLDHPLAGNGSQDLISTAFSSNSLIVVNNVFSANGANTVRSSMSGALAVGANLFQTDMTIIGADDVGGNITGEPTFVDAANGDYRLAAGSLGIDAANYHVYEALGGGALDLIGARRFADACDDNTGTGAIDYLDMGAFETQTPVINMTTGATYDTISDAVAAATSGDTIELACGTYYEHDLFINKVLTIRGQGMDETIIDANYLGRCLRQNGSTLSVEGLTLQNGFSQFGGGGMLIQGASAASTFRQVRFLNNESQTNGGGLSRENSGAGSTVKIERCEFIGNRASGPEGANGSGGALLFISSNGTTVSITNTLFANNTCRLRGGVLYAADNTTINMINNTIVGHTLSDTGSNILIGLQGSGGQAVVSNCVFADNEQPRVFSNTGTLASVGFSVLQNDMTLDGATDDGGNITATPLFQDAANGDYRLAAGSQGIDAANSVVYLSVQGPLMDLNGDARLRDDMGTANTGFGTFSYLDMGAYEFQGFTPLPCIGDVTGDERVNVDDLNAILSAWGTSVGAESNLDLANDDGFIDVDDLNVVLGNWGHNCDVD